MYTKIVQMQLTMQQTLFREVNVTSKCLEEIQHIRRYFLYVMSMVLHENQTQSNRIGSKRTRNILTYTGGVSKSMWHDSNTLIRVLKR